MVGENTFHAKSGVYAADNTQDALADRCWQKGLGCGLTHLDKVDVILIKAEFFINR